MELLRLTEVSREPRLSVTSSSGSNHLWRAHLDRVFPHWKERESLPSLEGDPGASRVPKAMNDAGFLRFMKSVDSHGQDITRDSSMIRINDIVNNRLLPFLKINAPHIAQSLQPVVATTWFEQIETIQERDFFRDEFLSLPGPLRALYFLLGGQDAGRRGRNDAGRIGLFGSFFVYDMSPSCYFLHPRQAIILAKKCEPFHEDPITANIFPFCSSLEARSGLPLTFGVDKRSRDAQVYVFGLKSKIGSREPVVFASPATPKGVGLIEWLDHYVQMLERRVYSMQRVPEMYATSPAPDYICLHPRPSISSSNLNVGSNVSMQITRGIKIIVGATRISLPDTPGLFSYRCWIENDGSTFPSVQLTHRTWVIKSSRGPGLENVHGEGVIGLTPVITDCDEEVFNYSSQTQVSLDEPLMGEIDEKPWMEGSFRFVPGSVESPTGPPFEAKVGRFYFDSDEMTHS